MISSMSNEVTDILYFAKQPFYTESLYRAHLAFLILRPALIIVIWPLVTCVNRGRAQSIFFPCISYLGTYKSFGDNTTCINVISTLLELFFHSIPLVIVQILNNKLSQNWSGLELVSLAFTFICIVIDVLNLFILLCNSDCDNSGHGVEPEVTCCHSIAILAIFVLILTLCLVYIPKQPFVCPSGQYVTGLHSCSNCSDQVTGCGECELFDSKNITCNACLSGYMMLTDNQCVKCSDYHEGCIKCQKKESFEGQISKCTQCASSFYKIGGSCTKSKAAYNIFNKNIQVTQAFQLQSQNDYIKSFAQDDSLTRIILCLAEDRLITYDKYTNTKNYIYNPSWGNKISFDSMTIATDTILLIATNSSSVYTIELNSTSNIKGYKQFICNTQTISNTKILLTWWLPKFGLLEFVGLICKNTITLFKLSLDYSLEIQSNYDQSSGSLGRNFEIYDIAFYKEPYIMMIADVYEFQRFVWGYAIQYQYWSNYDEKINQTLSRYIYSDANSVMIEGIEGNSRAHGGSSDTVSTVRPSETFIISVGGSAIQFYHAPSGEQVQLTLPNIKVIYGSKSAIFITRNGGATQIHLCIKDKYMVLEI
ncbi:hypothetical protein FGO68_gene7646 [Halteria grandinella]|uniref:Uncharacterized protein n=1 Tax=Halteria grandinella TaxID=5974 RepID=A0A8J8NXF2_HALGN|nr:hypothetical protein FGO68_gene7646 [Halteria grandinella]